MFCKNLTDELMLCEFKQGDKTMELAKNMCAKDESAVDYSTVTQRLQEPR